MVSSYLSERSQRVSVNGERSNCYPLPFGVPQGSCLGPLLFRVYASKLFDVIKLYLPNAHAFSDGTQLYLSFNLDNSLNEAEAVHAMELCIRAIRAWMQADKLKFNENKTEVMLIGTRQQLSKVNLDTLIVALVIGRLGYCNSPLYGLPASYVIKLQRVQNAAARFISNTTRFDHISPVMKDLHWLPVKYRIMFKLVVYTFNALHGIAPTYIHQLTRLKPQSNYYLRSNTIDLPNKTKKTTGKRAFFAAAPTLRNALPDELRALGSLKTFMARLKTHYFKLAFSL